MNIEFEDGGIYTLIGTSALAFTTQREVKITLRGREVLYQVHPKRKGSRTHYLVVTDDELVFKGNDIPFMSDFAAVKEGLHDHFMGDCNLNLFTDQNIEEVRRFISEKNLNQFVDLGLVRVKGTPVYPELCEELLNEKQDA